MATISKFYLHDAATPNTGTMPTGAFIGGQDGTGDATGARTARSANDTIGALQTSAVVTTTANVSSQFWGYRRFVSAPLAATTFANADGNWTFSYARSENNLLHNQSVVCLVYFWRPSTGAQIGSIGAGDDVTFNGTEPTVASTQQTESLSAALNSVATSIIDGDILVFEVSDSFTQGMSTSYTSSFFYDGTTEASATSCASFITPPAPLTLFTATPVPLPFPHQSVPFYPRPSRPS